eukprot:6415570-Alexandrium_andersonii.AAC.1
MYHAGLSIVDWIRERTHGLLLTVLGRDTKRRAAMDPAGYLFRLYQGCIRDAELYVHRPELSLDDIARILTERMYDMLPRWVQIPRPFAPSEMAYGYRNYKGKCLGFD